MFEGEAAGRGRCRRRKVTAEGETGRGSVRPRETTAEGEAVDWRENERLVAGRGAGVVKITTK